MTTLTPPDTLRARLEDAASRIDVGFFLGKQDLIALLREAAATLPVEAEGRATGWIVVVPQASWTCVYGPFPSYDGCTEWARAQGYDIPSVDIYPLQPLPAPPARQET